MGRIIRPVTQGLIRRMVYIVYQPQSLVNPSKYLSKYLIQVNDGSPPI